MQATSASEKNSDMRFFRTYWATVLIAAAILYLSITTGEGLPRLPLFPNADKLVHFLMYAALAAAATWEMRKDGKNLLFTALGAVVLASAYGGALELIQPYFPPRTCDLLDFIADAAGAGFSFIITDTVWKWTHCSTR